MFKLPWNKTSEVPETAEQPQSVRLLAYWTRRYVLVLLSSLTIVAVIAGLWVRSNAYEQSYQLLTLRASQIADLGEELLETNQPLDKLRLNRDIERTRFALQTVDEKGRVRTLIRGKFPNTTTDFPNTITSYARVLRGDTVEEEVQVGSQIWVRIGVPVYKFGKITNALYLSLPVQEALPGVDRLYVLIALLIGAVALAGWFVIYFLSRKLTAPLLQVAEAAQTIAEGDYKLTLPEHLRERELQLLVSSFQNMAHRLQQLEDMRTELLAGVSHELRTPITSIRGMIQAVQSKVVTDEEAEEFLQISFDEAKRLQQMVEELLSFSSLEAGATKVHPAPVNLTELVNEVIQQLGVLPEFSSIRLEQDTESGELWTLGDAGFLRQILLNLLNNSRAASPADAEIRIAMRKVDDEIQVDVSDEGRGIPEEEQLYIFERFYRGRDKQKKSRGLGLGLTLSRLLARAHQGDLVLLQSSPKGTTFRLTLPVSKAAKAAAKGPLGQHGQTGQNENTTRL